MSDPQHDVHECAGGATCTLWVGHAPVATFYAKDADTATAMSQFFAQMVHEESVFCPPMVHNAGFFGQVCVEWSNTQDVGDLG